MMPNVDHLEAACLVCGSPVGGTVGKGRPRKFCSLECITAARRIVDAHVEREVSCEVCGKSITETPQHPRRYCSDRCSTIAWGWREMIRIKVSQSP